MTMTVPNYSIRQFHRTSNGENPSSGYRDMGSASLAAARLAAHPDRDDNTPPARIGVLRGKNVWELLYSSKYRTSENSRDSADVSQAWEGP